MSVSYTADHLRVRYGVVNPPQFQEFTITVNTHDIDVFNVTEDDIKYLDSVMVASKKNTKKKGKGKNKNATDTVENSKHTKTFQTNIDIKSILDKMKMEGYIEPSKMNLYTEGASHQDDEPPEGLMGTLVMILPTTYSGGEFIFSTFNIEDALPKDKLRFVYYEPDLEHTVNQVLSGNRITLVYNIFYDKTNLNVVYPVVEVSPVPAELYGNLLNEAIQFCHNKKNILLGTCKYGNEKFHTLMHDLKKHFKIIATSLDAGAGNLHIKDIKEVYEMDEDEMAEQGYDQKGDEFDDYILRTHEVRHILYPTLSVVGEKQEMYKFAHGNEDYTIEFYRCYLINPDTQAAESADGQLAKRMRH